MSRVDQRAVQIHNTDHSKDLIHPGYKRYFYEGLAVTALSGLSFLFPFEALKIIGAATLNGIGYKTLETLFLAKDSKEYFTVPEERDITKLENRIVRSKSSIANALIQGPMNYRISLIAGSIFALLSQMPIISLPLKIAASKIYICLGIISLIALIYSQIKSKLAEKDIARDPYEAYEGIPLSLQSKWEACTVREDSSSRVFGWGHLLLSISIIASRSGLISL